VTDVTIVPKPCGQFARWAVEPLVCGQTRMQVNFCGEVREKVWTCPDCKSLGYELMDVAFTYYTDARTDEDQWCLQFGVLAWNLTIAALLCSAAERAIQNSRIVIQSRVHTDDWTGYVPDTSFDQVTLDMDYDGDKT
jgi:hypothetical protein